MFSLGLTKKFSSQNGEKTRVEKILTKMPMCTVHMGFVHAQCFFFPPNHLHIYNFFFILFKNVLLFVLFNGVIIIYLYQLHFSNLSFFLSTKQKFFISPLFHPHNQKKNGRKLGPCLDAYFSSLKFRYSSLITHHSSL